MSSVRNAAIAATPGIAQLLTGLSRVCLADGLSISELRAIRFAEDEVSIEIVRADGRRRTNTYPLAVLSEDERADDQVAARLAAVVPLSDRS